RAPGGGDAPGIHAPLGSDIPDLRLPLGPNRQQPALRVKGERTHFFVGGPHWLRRAERRSLPDVGARPGDGEHRHGNDGKRRRASRPHSSRSKATTLSRVQTSSRLPSDSTEGEPLPSPSTVERSAPSVASPVSGSMSCTFPSTSRQIRLPI